MDHVNDRMIASSNWLSDVIAHPSSYTLSLFANRGLLHDLPLVIIIKATLSQKSKSNQNSSFTLLGYAQYGMNRFLRLAFFQLFRNVVARSWPSDHLVRTDKERMDFHCQEYKLQRKKICPITWWKRFNLLNDLKKNYSQSLPVATRALPDLAAKCLKFHPLISSLNHCTGWRAWACNDSTKRSRDEISRRSGAIMLASPKGPNNLATLGSNLPFIPVKMCPFVSKSASNFLHIHMHKKNCAKRISDLKSSIIESGLFFFRFAFFDLLYFSFLFVSCSFVAHCM